MRLGEKETSVCLILHYFIFAFFFFCQLFKSTQLAEADSVMGRVSSSPLPGLDDEVKDLNKRWEQVREQLQSRLVGVDILRMYYEYILNGCLTVVFI